MPFVLRAPFEILFLDQGRAWPQAALGHVRARHAFEAGSDGEVAAEWASVPPMGLGGRLATKVVPGIGRANLWSVRFALVRSVMARRLLRARLRGGKRFDAVQITTDQVALALGRLRAQAPCVLSLDSLYLEWNRMTHGVGPGAPTPWFLRPMAFLERRALAKAPLVIAWTEKVAADVRRLAPTATVQVLHPGIDVQAFLPAQAAPRDTVRVLFVGGRWEAKGGPALVEALRPELGSGVELNVVTAGPVPDLDGVVERTGTPGSDEMLKIFQDADVFCLPTTADACPWVVLEAMACAVPVVATRVGSIGELVGDGGVVVEPGSPEQLRGALMALIRDTPRRRALGAAARARIEAHYDARASAPRLVELLRSATEAR